MRRPKIIFGLLLFLLFLIWFTNDFLSGTFQKKNYRSRYFKMGSIEENIAPIPDPVLAATFSLAESEKYYLNEEFNSDVVDQILKNVPSVNSYVENKKFSSLYSLANFLILNGKYNEEYKILEYYMKNSFDGDINERDNFIEYVRFNYFSNSTTLIIDDYQISRGRWLMNEGIKRILLIDTDPLDNEPGINPLINELLLTTIATSDLHSILMDASSYPKVLPTNYEEGIDLDESNTQFLTDTTSYRAIKLYWIGVKYFKNEDFINAISFFTYANQFTKDNLFQNLIKLMQMRCMVWNSIKNNFSNSKEVINYFEKDKENLKYSTIKSDIEYYIKFLKDPTFKNQEKLPEVKFDIQAKSNIDFFKKILK